MVIEMEVLRAHSVSPASLRRMPSSVLRSAGLRLGANPRVHKMRENLRRPFALKPVPVSQAIEVRPEINSGEINPVAVCESLAPEIFMGREVKRCRHCHLRQFITANGLCRKCRQSLAPEPQPDVQPAMSSGVEIKSFGNIFDRVDTAFAVKLLRQLNGFSQNDLAKRMQIARAHVSRFENYGAVPGVESIEKLAIALNVTPYILVTLAEAACAA